jgi:serine/threonine protein kinase
MLCCASPHTQVFLTPQYLGIAMEFASGGDMFEYVVKKNGLREEEARWFFQQLIVGLDYCHRMVRTHDAAGAAAGAGSARKHAAASNRPGGRSWRAATNSTAHQASWGKQQGAGGRPCCRRSMLAADQGGTGQQQAPGSSLQAATDRHHAPRVPDSTATVLLAVCCCLQGVVNRDIKLENTLLDSSPRPLVKICDFGYSKVCWRQPV